MTCLDRPISQTKFVVVDVECTVARGSGHRLIEVGMVVVEQGTIVRRYSSLINPHMPIPEFIETMTGIGNQMVAAAPEEDIAIVPIHEELMADNAVFVGHNVGFDWNLVAKALADSGVMVPEVVRLCTCKLARRLFTDLKRHNLDAVATHCGVTINERHRALGDAEATAEVLLQMIDHVGSVNGISILADLVTAQNASRASSARETKAKQELAPYLDNLPAEPGVYYFYTTKRKLLYVGKAKNLSQRVRSYFGNAALHGKHITRMVRYVKHIEWVVTGTELGAMLLESREIKERRPSHNVLQREYVAPWFLSFSADEFPRLDVVNNIENGGTVYYGPFRSRTVAERLRELLGHMYRLRTCEGTLRPRESFRPCFDYHLGRCPAPCALLESAADYAVRVAGAKASLGKSEHSAIALLRQQMEVASDAEQFELAAFFRDGIRELERVMVHQATFPLPVLDLNVVIVVPLQDGSRVAEVFALKAGRLCAQGCIGAKAPTAELCDRLRSLYTLPSLQQAFTEIELDELRIVTAWLYHQNKSRTTFVVDASSLAQLESQLTEALSNAFC